jgi:hypothetical protein
MKHLLLCIWLFIFSWSLRSQDSMFFQRTTRVKYYEYTDTRTTMPSESKLPTALFYVQKKNGFMDTVRGNIRYVPSLHSWVLKSGKQKLFPSETFYVYRVFQEDTLFGYPENNTWLFSCLKGTIHGYSANSFYNPGTWDVTYVKKEGDTTLYHNTTAFRWNRLGTIISDDSLLYQEWKWKSNVKKTGVYGFVFAGCMVGVAACSSLIKDQEAKKKTITAAGVGIILGCLYGMVTLVIPLNTGEMIEAYNVNRMRKEQYNYFEQNGY